LIQAAVISDVGKWKHAGFDIIVDFYFLWITWEQSDSVGEADFAGSVIFCRKTAS